MLKLTNGGLGVLEACLSVVACGVVALMASVVIGFGLWLGVLAAETVMGGGGY